MYIWIFNGSRWCDINVGNCTLELEYENLTMSTSRYSDITSTATPAVKSIQMILFMHLWAVMVLNPLGLLAALDTGCAMLLKQFRVGLDNTERLVREFGRSRAGSDKGEYEWDPWTVKEKKIPLRYCQQKRTPAKYVEMKYRRVIQGLSPAVAGETSGLDLTECLLHGGDILSKSCSTVEKNKEKTWERTRSWQVSRLLCKTVVHDWHCRCLWDAGRCPLWKRSVASCTRCLRCCRMFCRCSCSCSSHCFCFSSRALAEAQRFYTD